MKSFAGTVEMLKRGVDIKDAEEWRRAAARVGWIKETMAALRAAHAAMMDRFDSVPDDVGDEEFTRICNEEQAKVDAILHQLHAVRDRDEWPAHLYFGGV